MNFYGSRVGRVAQLTFLFLVLTSFSLLSAETLNRAPVAKSMSLETIEGKFLDFKLQGSDPDNAPRAFTYHLNTRTVNGSLKGTPPNKRYTPNPGFVGTDEFIYKTFDGESYSTPVKVTINVKKSENIPPVAQALSLETTKGKLLDFKLQGSDSDNAPRAFTYHLDSRTSHGSLKGTPPNKRYIPDPDFVGTDEFYYRVFDGSVSSPSVKVTIQVKESSNARPVANALSFQTNKDEWIEFELQGSDPDNSPRAFTYHLDSRTSHGKLTGTAPKKRYVPDSGFVGTDEFLYRVFDGEDSSETVKVTINVTDSGSRPDNTPPVVVSSSASTKTNTPVTINLIASDEDGDQLFYLIASQPSNGSLGAVTGNKVTYTPKSGYSGNDSFRFRVGDGKSPSLNDATVSITVVQSNQSPTASPVSKSTKLDTPVAISLVGSDPDGDQLQYSIVKSPSNGSLGSVSGNKVTYTPKAGFSGSDSFTYKVSDSESSSSVATVSLTVTAGNQAPVANASSVSASRNTPVVITLAGSDADGDTLKYAIVKSASQGSLGSVSGNSVTYTPKTGYEGGDSFTFRVNDGTVNSNTATVTITVTGKVDIDLDSPRQLSLTTIATDKLDLAVTDTHAFVASGDSGVIIYSKINSSKLDKVKTLNIGGFAKSLRISANKKTLFVADQFFGLRIVDITNPASAKVIGSVQSFGFAKGLAVSSDTKYVYLADDSYVVSVDVSNLSNPKVIGSVKISTGSASAAAITPNNKYVLIATGTGGLHIIDVSSPALPKIASRYDTAGVSHDVTSSLDGKYAYLADGLSGVSIFNIGNPSSPSRVKVWNTKQPAHDVLKLESKSVGLLSDGATLLVGAGSGGVYGLDVNNPGNPVIIGNVDSPSLTFDFAVSSDDSKLYSMDFYDGLIVFDIGN